MGARRGAGLVELIVALTVFTVGLLGLAGAAAVAYRSFNEAAGLERSTEVVAAVIDSLLRTPDPVAGERQVDQTSVSWSIDADSTMRTLHLTASPFAGPAVTYTVVHSERPR